MEQAVSLALAQNLGLSSNDLQTAIKKRDHDYAWNQLMPTVAATGNVLRLNTAPTTFGYSGGGLALVQINPWMISGGFSVQWNLSMALLHAIDQTSIDYQNSVISAQSARQQLIRDVKKAFNQLLALNESIKVTQNQIANAEDRYRQTKASYQSGLASSVSMLQAQVSWANLKPTLENQELAVKQAMRAFAYLLGLDVRTPLTLVGKIEIPQNLPLLDPSVLLEAYLDRRFDVMQTEGALRSQKNLQKLQNDQLWPTFSISYSASPTLSAAFDPATDWGNSANWLDSSGSLTFLLRWQLDSLIPGFSTWTKAQDTNDSLRLTQISLAQVRQAAGIEVSRLTDQISASAQSLKTLDLNVDLAQKSYDQTEAAYQAGSQTLLDVQGADLQLQSAQLQVLNEKLTLVNGLLDLEYSLNATKNELLKGAP